MVKYKKAPKNTRIGCLWLWHTRTNNCTTHCNIKRQGFDREISNIIPFPVALSPNVFSLCVSVCMLAAFRPLVILFFCYSFFGFYSTVSFVFILKEMVSFRILSLFPPLIPIHFALASIFSTYIFKDHFHRYHPLHNAAV